MAPACEDSLWYFIISATIEEVRGILLGLTCFRHVVVGPCTPRKDFGLGFCLSEVGLLPSRAGGVSSKAAPATLVPAIAVPSRPSSAQVVLDLSDLPAFSPPLSLVPTLLMMRRTYFIIAMPARSILLSRKVVFDVG